MSVESPSASERRVAEREERAHELDAMTHRVCLFWKGLRALSSANISLPSLPETAEGSPAVKAAEGLAVHAIELCEGSENASSLLVSFSVIDLV